MIAYYDITKKACLAAIKKHNKELNTKIEVSISVGTHLGNNCTMIQGNHIVIIWLISLFAHDFIFDLLEVTRLDEPVVLKKFGDYTKEVLDR